MSQPEQPAKSSAEEPWPVRVVSQKIGAWVAKLGWVWVDGQVAQISRRPGASVVFLTLRDPSADLSLTVMPGLIDLQATPGATGSPRLTPRPRYCTAHASERRSRDCRSAGSGMRPKLKSRLPLTRPSATLVC